MGRTSSSERPFLGGSVRYSSASPSTRFMWRSKAMNLSAVRKQAVSKEVVLCSTSRGSACFVFPRNRDKSPHLPTI